MVRYAVANVPYKLKCPLNPPILGDFKCILPLELGRDGGAKSDIPASCPELGAIGVESILEE